MTRKVTEADVDRAVAEAFGREVPGTGDDLRVVVQAFQEAGFPEDLAERGAAMLESGHYFGFEDVATSLWTWHHAPLVEAKRVQDAGDRLRRIQESRGDS